MSFWTTIVGKGLSAMLDPMTALRQQIAPDAPAVTPSVENGGLVDTTQADEDKERQRALVAELQQKAAFGDPLAEGQLRAATQKTLSAESAMGQTQAAQRGLGVASALRNIGDAQAHTTQAALGQSEQLKALSQMQAQQQLNQLLSGARAQDVNQAQAQQQAQQAMAEANANVREQQSKQFQGMSGGLLGGVMSLLSRGGRVDGRAVVGGDSEANDTVPAMLSPGEIVLPRSVTRSRDPAVAAAAFVSALKSGRGVSRSGHFDSGGEVDVAGIKVGRTDEQGLGALDPRRAWDTAGRSFGIGHDDQSKVVPIPLDTAAANDTRAQQQALADALAGGAAPSAVSAKLQASTDENLQAAMAAQAAANSPAAAGRMLGAVGDAQQRAAQAAANERAGETAQAAGERASLLGAMRGQSQAQAQIAQRAALETQLMNMGLDAAHRAAVLGQIGALGQGLAAAGSSGMFSAGKMGDTSPGTLSELSSLPYGYGQEASSPDEWANPYSGGSEPGTPDWAMAHGGEVPEPDFVELVGRGGQKFKAARKGLSAATVKKYGSGGEVPPSGGDVIALTSPSGRKVLARIADLSPGFMRQYMAGRADEEAFDSIPAAGTPSDLVQLASPSGRTFLASRADLSPDFVKKYATGQADEGAFDAIPPVAGRDRGAPSGPTVVAGDIPQLPSGQMAQAPQPPAQLAPIRSDPAWEAQQAKMWEEKRRRDAAESQVASLQPQPTTQHLAEGGPVLPQGQQDQLTASFLSNPASLARLTSSPPTAPSPLAGIANVARMSKVAPEPPAVVFSGGHQGMPGLRPPAEVAAENSARYMAWQQTPAGMSKKRTELIEAGRGSGPGGAFTDQEKALMGRADLPDASSTAGYGETPQTSPGAETAEFRPMKPPGASPAGPPAAAVKHPAAARQAVSPWAESNKKSEQALSDEQKAIAQQADLAKQRGAAEADLIKQRQADMAGADAEQARMAADYQSSRAEQQKRLDALVRDYSDTKIDPSQFWASKTTGDRVLAGIGLALGAIGAGATGVNQSVGIITQAIDRDIDAQKANLAKKGAAVGEQRQLLSVMRQNFSDDSQAQAATRSAMLATAQARADELAARARGPEEAARLAAVSAGLATERIREQQKLDLQFRAQAATERHQGVVERLMASRAAGKGAGESTGMGAAAIDRLERLYSSGHITRPFEYEHAREAAALQIATERNGGKMPRAAAVKLVKDGLPNWATLSSKNAQRQFNDSRRLVNAPIFASAPSDSGGGGEE